VQRPTTARRRLSLGPLSAPIAEVAGAAACVGFLVAVAVRPETRSTRDLVIVAAALAGGMLVARITFGLGSARIVGGTTSLLAAWLLPQRTDIASAVILAAFFGAGIGLMVGRVGRAPSERVAPPRGRRRATRGVLFIAIVVFAAYVGAETPGSHWFGGGITRGPAGRREVALTFDDGPNVTATLPIMKLLDAAHITGTFFEVGKAIDADPQITRALYEHKQLLGNHSYNHDQWRWLDPRYPELERTQQAFQRAIGVCPAYYRPPHGDRTPFIAHVVSNHHMRIVMWDDSAGDWAVNNPRTIARRILRGVKPGAIIVLHDGLDGIPTKDRKVLVRALPLIIHGLRARHYDVVGLDQLIGGPATVPCS
jgi:peptidoglycan/xylan/chitin deacetylase (PgdA/CDA1 family)